MSEEISGLGAITGASVASGDLTVLVDVSDTSMAGTGTNKKITFAELVTALTSLGTLATDAELAALSTVYQPLDSDLTAIAALTTTATGRSLLAAVDATALRSILGLGSLAAATTINEYFCIAVGDETTAITTGTAKVTFRMPFAMTVTAVRASLTTASSSGTPTFDINDGGTTILSTKLTIDANEKTSTTAAAAAVISDTALADDAEITIDVDVAGTAAAGAKVWIYGTRTV